jgi:hypothetical protein
VWVNLSTGALGTVQNGANWANARATVVNMGNGWYRVSLVARKTNAATSVVALIFSATADASAAYAGSAATVATLMWRASMTLSNVPALSTQTTSAAVAASTPSGSALSVKGLPVSTAGLLLAGDWVEIDGQLKMVTASLDSDAAGLGYLQFSPPLARAIADSTPIIVHKPMGRFILSGDSAGWSNEPGPFSSASLELEEAALS